MAGEYKPQVPAFHDELIHRHRGRRQPTDPAVASRTAFGSGHKTLQPAIARTITELGVDLRSIQTTSTIESGLRNSITGTVA